MRCETWRQDGKFDLPMPGTLKDWEMNQRRTSRPSKPVRVCDWLASSDETIQQTNPKQIGEGLAKWPVYAADTQWQVMHLGPEPMAAPDRHRAQDVLLDRIWGK
jgi:hypothetical protein